jgi:hypothetical protein
MATIAILLDQKVLTRIIVRLGSDERQKRFIYGFPEFQQWLEHELPALSPGRLRASETPLEQVDNALYRWVVGKPIIYNRQFKDLVPLSDEVWEMKTADTRIFGWMYKPLRFVAVFGDYADLYKGKSRKFSYEDAKKRVLAQRNKLDLDLPKYVTGAFDELVYV